MKQLLVAALLTLGCVQAQQARAQTSTMHSPAGIPVSKAAFTEKVKQLDDLLKAQNTNEANTVFTEINKMVNAEYMVIRSKVDAATATEEKTSLYQLAGRQRKKFAEVMQLKRVDAVKNRDAIVSGLNDIGESLL